MNQTSVEVASQLFHLRKESKQSLASVANNMKTGTKHLWRLENGKVDPRIGTIARFATALGLSVHIIFSKDA